MEQRIARQIQPGTSTKIVIFLKNYTSSVPVSETIARIEKLLIRCGVKSIEKEYDPHAQICAVRFKLETEDGKIMPVRIPVNEDQALQSLWLNYADGERLTEDGSRLLYDSYKKKRRADFSQQAARTAWRLMQDWIEVQMSMIQLKQADKLEVFMPFVWNGTESFYQRIKNNGYRALLPEHSQP